MGEKKKKKKKKKKKFKSTMAQTTGRFAPTPFAEAMRRTTTSAQAPERPLWLGPYTGAVPPYLDGSLVGDYGWDTSGLSTTPEALLRNRDLELIHARWAMAGALGALLPELLSIYAELPSQNPSGSRQEPRSSRQEAWITSVTHPSSTPSRSLRSSAFKSSSWDSLKAIGWQEDPSGKPQKGYTQGNPSTLSVSLKTPTPSSNFRLKKSKTDA